MGMLIVAANIMNALGLWIYNCFLRKVHTASMGVSKHGCKHGCKHAWVLV